MYAYIYGLHDPRTQQLRYVGKTNRPGSRLSYHVGDKRNTHKGHWIMGLISRGLKPIMRIIEKIEDPHDEIWPGRERYWIRRAQECGCRLTNLDEGGLSGFKKHPDTLERMRIASTGRIQTQEEKDKRAANQRGRECSPETRAKIGNGNRGKSLSESTRAKIREARARQVITEETRRKLSASSKSRPFPAGFRAASISASIGRVPSEETRCKMSEAAKRRGPHASAVKALKLISESRKGIPRSQEVRDKIKATKAANKALQMQAK